MVRVLLVLVLLLLLAAPTAGAATRTEVLQDCQDGSLAGSYTPTELRDARDNIPADIDQYSDCRDVLSRALTSGAGGASGGSGAAGGGTSGASGTGGGDGGGGGGASGATGTGSAVTGATAGLGGSSPAQPLTPSGPEEATALAEAGRDTGSEPIRVGEQAIVPGATGFDAGAVRNELPGTLIVTLVLLAVTAVAAAAAVVRRRVVGRRTA